MFRQKKDAYEKEKKMKTRRAVNINKVDLKAKKNTF